MRSALASPAWIAGKLLSLAAERHLNCSQAKHFAGKVLEKLGGGLSPGLWQRVKEARELTPEKLLSSKPARSAWAAIKVGCAW